MLAQRRRRWADVVQMLCKRFVFTELLHTAEPPCFLSIPTLSLLHTAEPLCFLSILTLSILHPAKQLCLLSILTLSLLHPAKQLCLLSMLTLSLLHPAKQLCTLSILTLSILHPAKQLCLLSILTLSILHPAKQLCLLSILTLSLLHPAKQLCLLSMLTLSLLHHAAKQLCPLSIQSLSLLHPAKQLCLLAIITFSLLHHAAKQRGEWWRARWARGVIVRPALIRSSPPGRGHPVGCTAGRTGVKRPGRPPGPRGVLAVYKDADTSCLPHITRWQVGGQQDRGQVGEVRGQAGDSHPVITPLLPERRRPASPDTTTSNRMLLRQRKWTQHLKQL